MPTLIINAGSSSLRFALFDDKQNQLYKGHIDSIVKNPKKALKKAIKRLQKDKLIAGPKEITKVGHRIVHGGEEFTEPTRLTALTIRKLQKLNKLAPLHNPANLEAVKASKRLLKKAKHYAIFDTAFHASLPQKAFLYGLPYKLYKKEGIRRYGFHGTNHKYVASQATKLLKKPQAKLITCHMGNGVSLAAIKGKTCLDTSMGFTPLEGPMMGTRSGSIDPAIIFHLAKKKPLEKIENLLQNESGFKGISGISSDIRKLWAKPKSPGTLRTFDLFSYQMAKYITSYFTPLKGTPDAIIFTAGIGQNAWYLRKQICDYLPDATLDPKKNKANATVISTPRSKIKVLVIPANEELQMVREIA
jgi:acetate kinase